jgi:hypothetical protein
MQDADIESAARRGRVGGGQVLVDVLGGKALAVEDDPQGFQREAFRLA